MGFKHFIGMIIGGLMIMASRFFWLQTCVGVSDWLNSIEKQTCLDFGNAFFALGAVALGLSFIGHIFHK